MQAAVGILMAAVAAAAPVEVSLRGSPESMERQRAVAEQLNLPEAETRADMERLERERALVAVPGGPHYEVAAWVNPYAVPEVRLFVERLARRYVEACGEPLVVTSLTRPLDEQPPNAHSLSVHPAGMAADFRIPKNPECREWIEAEFLELEEQGVIDATRELRPPHYHVAIFPQSYARFAAARAAQERPEGVTPGAAGAITPGEEGAVGEHRESAGWARGLLLALLAVVAVGVVLALAVRWAAGRSRGTGG